MKFTYFLIFQLAVIAKGEHDALLAEIERYEDAVSVLSGKARQLMSKPCSAKLNSCQNDGCSRHACAYDLGMLEYSELIGGKQECSPAEEIRPSDGLMLNLEESFVRTPPNRNPDKPGIQADVCATKALDSTFKDLFEGDEYNLGGLTYLGTESGVFRSYPGLGRDRSDIQVGSIADAAEECSPYDPRIRPWYLSAASGPKDVVILIDTSGSMVSSVSSSNTRMDVVQNALERLLDTFSYTDYIKVIEFADEPCSKMDCNGGLVKASKDEIKRTKVDVSQLYPFGGTNFRDAFRKAFDILQESRAIEGGSSGCTPVILFLTDGIDQSDLQLEEVREWNEDLYGSSGKEAIIFTYSMGQGADTSVPKKIACDNHGVWSTISDNEDPLVSMSQYFKFLAEGIKQDEVRWAEPYEDASGLGKMTTAAKVVRDDKGHMRGVVGTDLLMSKLEEYDDYNDVLFELTQRSSVCHDIQLSECQTQILRGPDSQCDNTDSYSYCLSENPDMIIESCNTVSQEDPFCFIGNDFKSTCEVQCEPSVCSNDFDLVMSIPVWVGIGTGVFVLGLGICCICMMCRPKTVHVHVSPESVPAATKDRSTKDESTTSQNHPTTNNQTFQQQNFIQQTIVQPPIQQPAPVAVQGTPMMGAHAVPQNHQVPVMGAPSMPQHSQPSYTTPTAPPTYASPPQY